MAFLFATILFLIKKMVVEKTASLNLYIFVTIRVNNKQDVI